jgi:hypothetical protein
MAEHKAVQHDDKQSRVRPRREEPQGANSTGAGPALMPLKAQNSRALAPSVVCGLQRTVGNRAVNRLLARLWVQRQDPAEGPPGEAPAAPPRLTDAQINQAIFYNRNRYDADNTRLIQNTLGVPATSTWDRESVLQVAQLQDNNHLQIDGMVGNDTFRAIDQQQRAAGAGTTTAESLLLFKTPTGNVAPRYRNIGGSHFAEGHFEVEAQFSERGNCGDWEYR